VRSPVSTVLVRRYDAARRARRQQAGPGRRVLAPVRTLSLTSLRAGRWDGG